MWRNTPMLKAIFLLVSLGFLLSACQNNTQRPATEPLQVSPPVSTATSRDPDLLSDLLDAADKAIENDHLTYPKDGSAYAIYEKILTLDPDHEGARRGLERIVERYVALATQALEKRQFATARSMLARARLINPFHPSIQPSAEQIRLISEADKDSLSLNNNDLQDQLAETTEALKAFARASIGRTCRFVISASNDSQGRLIYRILSAALHSTRLRAQIMIRHPVSVERLCFDGSAS